jgi:hypothetical protein
MRKSTVANFVWHSICFRLFPQHRNELKKKLGSWACFFKSYYFLFVQELVEVKEDEKNWKGIILSVLCIIFIVAMIVLAVFAQRWYYGKLI